MYFYKKLKFIRYFSSKSNEFIGMIGEKLSLIFFLKNDIIFEKNNYAEEIYFIKKGKIEILGSDNSIIYTINEGNYFGEWDFFFNDSIREFTARSSDKSILYYLRKKDINEIYFNNFIQYKQEMISNSYKLLKELQLINLRLKIKKNSKKIKNNHFDKLHLPSLKKAKKKFYKNKNESILINKIDKFNSSLDLLNLKLNKILKYN